MADFLSPGSKVTQKRKGPVVLPGIATAIAGMLLYTAKGTPGKPYLITGDEDGQEQMGGRITSPGNGRLVDSMADFFNQGGQSMYGLRYIGSGSALAASTLYTTGGATSGKETSNASTVPVALAVGDTFVGSVDGVAQGTVTIAATLAIKTGSGATFATVAASTTAVVLVAGIPGNQTITFDGTENSLATYLSQFNSQLRGARAISVGGQISLQTDILGSSASGSIVSLGGTLAATTGLSVGAFTNAGPNNVATIDAVTGAELKTLFDATFQGTSSKSSTTTVNANGSLTWSSNATGATSSVQFTSGTGVAKIAGFDTTLHPGTNSSTVPTGTLTAESVGTWANVVSRKVTKNDVTVTTVAATAAGSTTSITVASTARLSIGDTISITKLTDVQRGVIQLINGTLITLTAAITVPSGGYAGTESVVLETFDVTMYDGAGLIIAPSPFRNLRMSSLAGANYFVNAINAAARTPVIAADLAAAATDPRPATDTVAVLLSGGSDGAAPTSSDVITQIANFDKMDDVSFISCPGAATDFPGAGGIAILKAIEAYNERRQDVIAIQDLPKGTPATGSGGVKDYVQNTVNFASSYEACYWPWVKRLDSVSGVLQAFPPSPGVMGIIARTHATRNFGKAPAGIVDGQFLNIQDLEFIIGEQSAEYNDFYPANVNAILKFKGQGFAIWGSRTMDPTGEFGQISVQTVFNVYKRLARRNTRFANFENNDTDLRNSMVRVLTSLFREGRTSKILKGAKDSEAFFIICDETNNTPSVIAKGKVLCRVGLATQRPGEFLDFTFEQDTRALDLELAGT